MSDETESPLPVEPERDATPVTDTVTSGAAANDDVPKPHEPVGAPVAETLTSEIPAPETVAAELDHDEADDVDAPLPVGGLYLAMSFLTRLPLGMHEMPAVGALARAMGVFPLVGIVVGGIGAAVYALVHQLLPAGISAVLALAATMLVTGGLHEDGLADTVDGFGGGADRDRKLAIMRDSRIGTYGVLALAVSFALRVIALAEIGDSLTVAGALIAAHALGRGTIPVSMQALIPARGDGLGAGAGQPSAMQIGVAITLAVAAAAFVLPASAALAALAGATIGMMAVIGLAQIQIGGYTGDVLGAVEQSAETLALLGVLAAL